MAMVCGSSNREESARETYFGNKASSMTSLICAPAEHAMQCSATVSFVHAVSDSLPPSPCVLLLQCYLSPAVLLAFVLLWQLYSPVFSSSPL
ncbi:hypothetical protein GUJ93_ZPchr0013g34066 [Zizania palustris]|uniref:Uncharacterized protein n=1 Tax=Zizania palustris TaxID=103762 RepID=A0A8J5WZB9_ZIZPA|nr:hypothetical protein GUJ93_ZPchr0013g34066 [Zizania palustris]